jgi:predicted glutamine amidotransferase
MVKGKENFSGEDFALSFSQKCKESKEWQGDGWGICWLNSKNEWEVFKSLSPIWEETEKFKQFPKSKIFLIHARSSTFDKDKGNIEFNQPFVEKEIAFVFNGEIRGVKGIEISGKIGSQKIFNLIMKYLPEFGIKNSILKVKEKIIKHSEKVKALNLGICDKRNFFVLSYYTCEKDYYELNYFLNSQFSIISSEEVLKFNFKTLKNGEILIL